MMTETDEIWNTIRRLKSKIEQAKHEAREEIRRIQDEEQRVSRECYIHTRELERQVEILSKVLADVYAAAPLPPVIHRRVTK